MSDTYLSFEVQNLGCASCAARMETAMNGLPEIERAELDFGSGKLYLTLRKPVNQSFLIPSLDRIIRSIEANASLVSDSVISRETSWHQSFPKKQFIRFLIGLLPFSAALFLPVPATATIVLYLAAWLILGYDVLLKALRKIGTRTIFDENFLMSIATVGALLIGEYPEAVAVMLFYQVGELFQDMAVNHSRSSIRALTSLRPDSAFRLVDEASGRYERVQPELVQPGDRLRIQPGERVPVDSVILHGNSDMDTSALTGESMPVPVGPALEILSGSVNGTGLLEVEVLRPYRDSAIARVLEMAEKAASRKSQAELFITRFAAWYTPAMVILAVLMAIVPPIVLNQPFQEWIYRSLILLVISCPCALVLSVPMSYFAGLGAASARGLLIKGGQYLERLAQVNQIVFDKTGTLTEGEFELDYIQPTSDLSEQEILQLAARLEGPSNHPIARSIRMAAGDAGLSGTDASEAEFHWDRYEDRPGLGILAAIGGHTYRLGNDRVVLEAGLDLPQEDAEQTGRQKVWLITDNQIAGYIVLTDRIRTGVPAMLKQLKAQGIRNIAMLSGDRPESAIKAAATLAIDEVHAGLLPEQKVERLERLMQQTDSDSNRMITAFVGDGINDAPVLARADLGIAVGSASDAAFESADMVLMGHDLRKLNEGIALARRTATIVRQNVALTLGLKAVVMLLAVIGFGGIWQAVFADVGVALLAVLNALRILRRQK